MSKDQQKSDSYVQEYFDKIWVEYTKLTPQAQAIHDLFKQQGEESIENDHVAFRTFQHPKMGVDVFKKAFEKLGYVQRGEYTFVEKKLNAIHMEFKEDPLRFPKLFISELETNKLSEKSQSIIAKLCDQFKLDTSSESFTYAGTPWKCVASDYETLAKESEYAAWMAAFGFCPNHFTVYINNLKSFNEVEEINQFVESKGFELNDSGGKIKGGPKVFLEQSSTRASKLQKKFEDATLEIPSCYYEFAKRYPKQDGQLYQGFVASSADKIFESTNRS